MAEDAGDALVRNSDSFRSRYGIKADLHDFRINNDRLQVPFKVVMSFGPTDLPITARDI